MENAIKNAKKVKPKAPVTIYGTAKCKSLVTGKAYTVHAELAEKLVNEGKATKEKPASKK